MTDQTPHPTPKEAADAALRAIVCAAGDAAQAALGDAPSFILIVSAHKASPDTTDECVLIASPGMTEIPLERVIRMLGTVAGHVNVVLTTVSKSTSNPAAVSQAIGRVSSAVAQRVAPQPSGPKVIVARSMPQNGRHL